MQSITHIIKIIRRCQEYCILLLGIGCLLLLSTTMSYAQNVDMNAYQAICRKYADHPDMRVFQARLEQLETLKARLESAFESYRKQALFSMLDDSIGRVPENNVIERPNDTALGLLAEYRLAFETPISAEVFSNEEQLILIKLYEDTVISFRRIISNRGRSIVAAYPQHAMRAMSLSLVLPMLHIPDDQWRSEDVEDLPAWILKRVHLDLLEDFALRAGRPLTAYSFHIKSRDETQIDRLSYLKLTADRMTREQRFEEAIVCLTVVVELYQTNNDHKNWIESIFRLSQILDDTGRSAEASEWITELLSEQFSDEVYSRALICHLKYLYNDEQYQAILEISKTHDSSSRVAGYQPQIMYITWVSARRLGADVVAASTQKEFLERFPRHVLGADLYFDQAMQSLAQSDYSEAERVLSYILYRYPQSRLISRIERIQRQLAVKEIK